MIKKTREPGVLLPEEEVYLAILEQVRFQYTPFAKLIQADKPKGRLL